MASDPSFISPPPFVEVSTSEGITRRFAAGTKANFAIDRINSHVAGPSEKYAFIESIKEGEEAVVFGPDAELVSYGEGWKLRATQDVKLPKVIDQLQTVRKELTAADFYPLSELPQVQPPGDAASYVWNLSWVCGCMFLLAGLWVYLLESQFLTR